jgi:hypothetical protein
MEMKKMKYWSIYLGILALTLALLGVTACTLDTVTLAPEATPVHPAPPERFPDIQGVSARVVIEDGVPTNDVYFSVNTPGYSIYSEWAGDIIYYLDVEFPDTPAQPATTTEGTYQRSLFYDIITWEDLSPGRHTFSAQLVTRSLTPLEPHMHADIELEVPPLGTSRPFINSLFVQMLCRPGYTLPDTPGRPQQDALSCADINVAVDVLNFKIVADKIGQQAAPGEGHFVYYFNVNPPSRPGEPALTEEGTYAITTDSIISWFGVLPGEYSVWVQLVNNDNTPLEPPLIAGATIIVPIDAGRYIGY